MIVTVTPNPSLDRTIAVEEFARGGVHRARQVRLDPGGKGINVSRAVAAADHPTVAVIPSGGGEGELLGELLAAEAVPVAGIGIGRPTRSNVAVVEDDGTTSKFNDPGPRLTGAEIDALRAKVAELAATADWIVSCGSLPSECPPDLHADLVAVARHRGARVAVDTSGPAFASACLMAPEVVKPNLAELAEWAGHPLISLGDVHEAAQRLRAVGPRTVLVSLGEHGALLIEAAGTWHASSSVASVRSTVGAGDAMLAGFLLAGASGPSALRAAVGYGAAAVALPGSGMPLPLDLRTDEVSMNELDENLNLTGAAV